ncbi:MAG: DUF554 domain-containing protein [Clostridia bacterium]|nr:DUF554 domain-containing protein [Clostridia bacterium]
MRGLGTLVNVIAILLGSGLGMLCKGGMKEHFRDILTQGCGLATVLIGLSGAFEMIFTVEGNGLRAGKIMLIVMSLVLGGLLGEALNLEKGLNTVGEKLRRLVRAGGDHRFVDGFVTASLVVCVGAMAICGSLEDGLTGNHQTLFVKSVLDFVIVAVFASVYGIGVAFSALSVGVLQGGITLCAVLIAPFLSDPLIVNLSGVGSVLIFAVGLNLLFPGKFRVANLLPALLIPVLYECLKKLPIFG